MSAGMGHEQVAPLKVGGHWDFRYEYYAGDAASRFFAELANKRIMGTVCPATSTCSRTPASPPTTRTPPPC